MLAAVFSALATIGGGLLLAALTILGFRWLFEGWKP
jgi:hypothetical protein